MNTLAILIVSLIVSVLLVLYLITSLFLTRRLIKRMNLTDVESAKELLAALKKSNKQLDEDIKAKQAEIEEWVHNQKKQYEASNAIRTANVRQLEDQVKQLTAIKQVMDTEVAAATPKLTRMRELYSAIEHAVELFHTAKIPQTYHRPLTEAELKNLDSITPSVRVRMKCMNCQQLRLEFEENLRQIDDLFATYQGRYTSKTSQSMYQLMLLALRAELQNALSNIKYGEIDNTLDLVREIVLKYVAIVSESNQSIAGTMRKFIGELEHLFLNAVHIESTYQVRREQMRQQQFALKQKMREETEEHARLQEQDTLVALDEKRSKTELATLESALAIEPPNSLKASLIVNRMTKLQEQLGQLQKRHTEIMRLQQGRSGYVYILSNKGIYGEQVFKIGLTKRLDPQEQVDEISRVGVPFSYDVHSFLFSTDAVSLVEALHARLHQNRVNRLDYGKDFFAVQLDDLEKLVYELQPEAEFNRTMMAQEYQQSLAIAPGELPPLSEWQAWFDDADCPDSELIGTAL
jgi:hypothetical protein